MSDEHPFDDIKLEDFDQETLDAVIDLLGLTQDFFKSLQIQSLLDGVVTYTVPLEAAVKFQGDMLNVVREAVEML